MSHVRTAGEHRNRQKYASAFKDFRTDLHPSSLRQIGVVENHVRQYQVLP